MTRPVHPVPRRDPEHPAPVTQRHPLERTLRQRTHGLRHQPPVQRLVGEQLHRGIGRAGNQAGNCTTRPTSRPARQRDQPGRLEVGPTRDVWQRAPRDRRGLRRRHAAQAGLRCDRSRGGHPQLRGRLQLRRLWLQRHAARIERCGRRRRIQRRRRRGLWLLDEHPPRPWCGVGAGAARRPRVLRSATQIALRLRLTRGASASLSRACAPCAARCPRAR